MNPVKCPNCRLTLPQNWSGANDPNARCPYCGKPVSGASTSTVAPQSPVVANPAPRAASGAKTILWGAGAGIAMPSIPKPDTIPPSTAGGAGASPPPPAPDASAAAPDLSASQAPMSRPDYGMEAPAPSDVPTSEPEPVKPMQMPRASAPPAATVMFQSSMAAGTNFSEMIERTEHEPPTPEEEAYDAETSRRSGSGSRSKYKPSKPASKKGAKDKSGKRWSTAEDDEPARREPGKSPSKVPIIAAVAVGFVAVVAVVAYFLRGQTPEPAKERPAPVEPVRAEKAPAAEPAGLAAKPITKEEFVPPKPATPEPQAKPAHAEKHADKAEKPEKVEHAEAKPAERPSDEDYRKASEAYERGNAKLFQGNTAEAINEFSLALKLNPKDPASHRALGLTYAQAGKAPEALKHLKAYLKEAPKANDRSVIEKRIEQLRSQ